VLDGTVAAAFVISRSLAGSHPGSASIFVVGVGEPTLAEAD